MITRTRDVRICQPWWKLNDSRGKTVLLRARFGWTGSAR